jgi:hypothetical protein
MVKSAHSLSASGLMISQPGHGASSASQVQRTKRPLTPSCVLPAQAAKRPRNLAYPSAQPQTPKQIRKPVGTSKQAIAKHRANEQVHNGTFTHNPKRWEAYKRKLAELDPNFEVSDDPRLVRQVKHSTCGGWFTMAAPYEKERFKNHIVSCSYSTRGGSMKSLESFGIFSSKSNTQSSPRSSLSSSSLSASPPASSPASRTSALPCPGLTENESSHISQYFARTLVTSAGGENLQSVAESLFSDEFKDLSKKKKELVRLKQKQTHTWSVDHLMKTIHAIGKDHCKRNAEIASDGSVGPCKTCRDLLTSRAFRNAISRKPAPNENRTYVPHIYQPEEIGKMYKLGFNDLMDGVSIGLSLQTDGQLISMFIDIKSQQYVDSIWASSCCRKF